MTNLKFKSYDASQSEIADCINACDKVNTMSEEDLTKVWNLPINKYSSSVKSLKEVVALIELEFSPNGRFYI